ncbi:MAG: hypothetical protein IJ181_05610 [Acidaminococcaceae bacterium]|nr:hypothetical protein [Acidaminococcaceae bacterium]
MEDMKKNPILMGVLSGLGLAVTLLLMDVVICIIRHRSFAEQVSDPVNLIILIAGTITTGISTYLKVKKGSSEKQDQ